MHNDWPQREVLTQVGPLSLAPGTLGRATLRAGLADIPLVVLAGVAPGPVLYVQALQHGLELNGVAVMRQVVRTVDPAGLCGTLILVPMANTLAARVHLQSYPYADRPMERRLNDMNRRWLDPLGGANQVDQVVATLAPIVRLADAMLDLHCHEYLYPAMALTHIAIPRCRQMALALGFEVVHAGQGTAGMFGRYCRESLGAAVVTVEMPPLRRVDARTSALGFQGVLNAMIWMGMLPGRLELPPRTIILGGGRSASVTAEREGYLARLAEPGQAVRQGDVVAEIWSPDTFAPVQTVRAPFDGILNSLGRPPVLWGDPEHDFINVGESAAAFAVPSETVCAATELGLA